METRRMLIPFALGLGLASAVLWLVSGGTAPATAAPECRPLQAPGDVITVCLSGGCDYTSVQAAVDAASDGNVIKVAAGTYTDVHVRPRNDVTTTGVVTQVIYISKTITLRGGYTTAFTDPPDPEANPTTLDAQGQGRVLYITGDISPTVEGLRIIGGNDAGLNGCPSTWVGETCGSGVYVKDAAVQFLSNVITNNVSTDSTVDNGGGIFLWNIGPGSLVSGNQVVSNIARWGGGIFLYESDHATLIANTVQGNIAYYGGGLRLSHSDAMLSGNTIISNTADGNGWSLEGGGGLYLWYSDATLNGNTITANTAHDDGGGLYLGYSDATLNGNTVSGNIAYWGGGLYLYFSDATLNGNTVIANTASWAGGLYLCLSDAMLDNNFVTDNASSWGGHGSGLYVRGSSPQLRHNTIAHNHGDEGEGLYVTDGLDMPSQPQLHNNILAGHTVGIYIKSGNTARLEGTLWGSGAWANDTDWGGTGTIITGTVNVWGDPDFVNPDAGDYHISAGSAAVDAGAYPPLNDDIDGEPRPTAFGPDIGADERSAPGFYLRKWAWQNARNPGQTVTYTLVVTGVGTGPVNNIILTDTLSSEQRVIASVASTGTCAPVAAAVWGGQVTCTLGTLDVGDSARITLTAQVTSTFPPALPWPMRNIVWATGTQAANFAYADVYLQDCHARLNDDSNEWDNVQAAVDASTQPADVVKVAGICAGINSRGGARQVLYINKTVTIRGGYTTTNWSASCPLTQPTTIDAQGNGRGIYITGDISPTVEGLRITGGDAAGPGDKPWGDNTGGGVYVISATATIRDNRILSNTARYGGGLYLRWSNATLSDNTVLANTADYIGGGLYLYESDAMLNDNTVTANTATYDGGGLFLFHSGATLSGNTVTANTADYGGGLILLSSAATLSGNIVTTNTADDGGGLYLTGSDGAMLDSNTVTSNTANDGGGLYLNSSDATLSGNTVSSNTAAYYGGGVYLYSSDATLSGNTVSSNTADHGGGLYLYSSDATINDNTVSSNTAYYGGGGLCLGYHSAATLNGNTVTSNTADRGGGLHLFASNATLSSNIISNNTANGTGWRVDGGGLYLEESDATLNSNIVSGNTASDSGGGLYLEESAATLNGNTISGNTANGTDWYDGGGGLYLYNSDATLSSNTVSGNTASNDGGGLYLEESDATLNSNIVSGNTASNKGGGLCLDESDARLTNNVIADNQADAGSGLYVMGSSPCLLHTTIARNTGDDGSGISMIYGSHVALTNTILVSHTVGITVTAGSAAVLEATMWGSDTWANTTDWGGAGTIVTGTVNVWGDPVFVDPDAGDYHIGPGSAAIDAGVDAGVTVDVDGEPRPLGMGYDIGSDEFTSAHYEIYLPLVMRSD